AKTADGKTTVDFTSDEEEKTTVTTTWIKEHGLWRLSELSTDEKSDENSKKSSKSSKKDKKSKDENSSGYFDSPEIDGYDNAVLSAGVDLSLNSKDLAFRVGADFFTDNGIVGYSIMYHRETTEHLGEDVGLNVFGFGMIVRIPIKMGEFGLNPYTKLNGNFAVGDSRLFIGYTAELGIQAMFNADGAVHFGLGAGVKQLFLTQWMDFDMSNDWDSRPEIENFTNRGISIYGILSF
uniref:hypothetical protein n=1 Tax=Treponema sp. TaxID=166 RepID=UPI00388F7D01